MKPTFGVDDGDGGISAGVVCAVGAADIWELRFIDST
jgi:hypothetical protein